MFDFHTHSLLSDGELLPSEVAVRYMARGFKTIAITDHADYSNIKSVLDSILEFTRHWPKDAGITVLPGVELTHLPPGQFKPLAQYARKRGARVIVAHGQSPAEPVMKGTNLAALKADIDILAHPGLITDEETLLAKKNGIFLEITCRSGHNATNRHVAKQALKFGAKLILDTDSHSPGDIISPARIQQVGRAAGLTTSQITKIYQEMKFFCLKYFK